MRIALARLLLSEPDLLLLDEVRHCLLTSFVLHVDHELITLSALHQCTCALADSQ